MSDAIIEFPRSVLRFFQIVRRWQWIAFLDVRVLLAAGPAVAVESSQISLFHESRIKLYVAALILSALAGVAYQLSQPKFTAWSCTSSFLNSGLFGLSLMLIGMSFDWGAEYPGALLGFSIGVGLCGPAATTKLQQTMPDAIAMLLHAAAERMAGTKAKPPEENGQ